MLSNRRGKLWPELRYSGVTAFTVTPALLRPTCPFAALRSRGKQKTDPPIGDAACVGFAARGRYRSPALGKRIASSLSPPAEKCA